MSSDTAWRLDREANGLACLTLDRPGTSANSLSRAVLVELGELLRTLHTQPASGLVVRSGKASGFIAGADVREFTRFRGEADALETITTGQRVFDQLEALPFPTVAAIQGFALGGGLELALACRYRVAVDDARLSLGLPEVQLGIHPGFGGTVRAVRLLGVRAAMELMLSGKPVRADRARAIGLVDRLVSAADLERAARQILGDCPPRRGAPFLDRLLSLPGIRSFLRSSLEARVARQARREHYPAPYAIIDLWVRYGARGRAAYEAEAHSIARLFSYGAWADKFEGAVHAPPLRGVALAMNEPIGVVGVVCPDEAPLLAFVSLVAPLVAMGNRVVVVPSERYPLAATDLYQVIETSDVPAGVINIVTGARDALTKTLAEHDDVDALWVFGSQEASAMAERLSVGNLKRTLVDHGLATDWTDPGAAEGPILLRHAVQVKNIWIPYGE